MPLLKNTFQPFFPDPNSPAPKDCNGQYCYPVASGDIVRQQWYQTPCGANLVEDPDFEDFSLGAEMITNGDFTTNADDWFSNGVEIGATACPATVDGWCFNTNRLGHDGTDTNDFAAYQTGIGLVAGNIYRVVWTVSGMTQGSIFARLGETTGSTSGAVQTSNDTFTEYIYYNDAQDVISFHPSIDFDGNIDDISLKLVTMTSWSGAYWVFDNDTACIPVANASAGNLVNGTSDYMEIGEIYEVEVYVDLTSGELVTYVDDGAGAATNAQTAITETGLNIFYITPTQDGQIAFNPSAGFAGCVSLVSVKRLRNDYTFELINAAGDSVDISHLAEYSGNKVNLNVDFSELREAGTIDYGCFTIYAYDSCLISGDDLVQDGDFSNGDFSQWTRRNLSYQFNMAGGELEFIFEPLDDNPTIVTNGDFAAGDTDWGHDGSWTVTAGGAVHTPGSTTPLTQTITTTAPPPLGFQWEWWQIVLTGRTAGSFTVTISDRTSTAYSTNGIITAVLLPTIQGSVTLSINPTSTFDGTITLIEVHQTTRGWSPIPQVDNPPNINIVDGNYQLDYDLISVTGTTPGTQGAISLIQWPTPTVYDIDPGAKSHTQLYTPGNTIIGISGNFRDPLTNIYYPGRSVVDNFSVIRIEPFEATYQSECLNFQETHPGTKMVTAYCDRDALGSTYVDALSFETDEYMLQMRIHCRSLNAYLDKEVNVSKFSNGNGRVTYAQYEKFWQFVTDYMSESALMTLGAMANCDHFHIGDTGSSEDTEYLAVVETFQPQWRAEGDYDLAPATINLRLKDGGMKFNRHT